MPVRIFRYVRLFAPLVLGSILLLIELPSHLVSAQTIPTRTPTPSGEQPTATRDSGGPGPNPTAQPTSTSRSPQATATFTPIPLPPTPEDGFLPTALPCGLPPTIRSLGSGINVRSGPGLAYDVVGALLVEEVRPIIGRAPQAAWWQTVMADGVVGWVADDVVEVSGYIGTVAVVEPPSLENGLAVTPGTPWAPTPRPDCTPPPTATSTSTPTASSTATAEEATVQEETETPTPASTDIVTPSATPTPEDEPVELNPTAAPLLGEEEEDSGAALWIPIVGVGLVLAAAGIFVAQRLRS